MEEIARTVNCENVFEYWLLYGVADGDINEKTTNEELEYYAEDTSFAELMKTFLVLMSLANKDGGLYCDNIVSK